MLAGLSASFVRQLVQERDRALQAEARAVVEQRNAQQARADALAQRDRATAAGDDAARERDRATAAGTEAARQRDAARQAEAAARADRQRAESARAQAQQQSATTAQVSDFLVSLFEGADPKRGGRPDTPVLALVDKGRARIDSQLRDQPALRAEMKGVLAKVYDNVGRPADAVALYEEAVSLERSPTLRRPLREADLLSRQAVALANDDRHPQAVAPARRALALRAARLPADSMEMADGHNTLGWVLARNGEHDEARRHLERALQIRRQHKGAAPIEVASTLHNLGLLEGRLDHLAAAEAYFQESLDLKRRHLPPDHTTVLNTVQALAANFGQQQKFEQALPLLEQLVAARRALTGPDSSMTAGAEHELAVVQRDSGRTAEALENYRRSMQSKIKHSGARSVNVAVTLNNIGGALEQLGDPAAEQSFRDSLTIRRERLPGNDIAVARAEATLARWLLRHERVDEARPLLAQAATTRAARLTALHTDRLETQLLQAQLHLAEGRAADAERLLAQTPPDALRLSQRIERLRLLAIARQAQGQAQDAVPLLRQGLAQHQQQIGALHPDGALRHLDLAEALWLVDDREGAAHSLAAAQPTLERHHAMSPARARHAALARRLRGP